MDDLATVDHYHARGFPATVELADRLPLQADQLIVDIGCGLGGPARYIAKRFQCKVSGVDITEPFVEAANKLTALLKMENQVKIELGDGQRLPYADASFDGGYTGIGFSKILAGAAFSVGLMLVVIAGAELFTGNNLMVSSVMSREITFNTMLKRWGVVFVANFIGSILVTLLFYYSGLWKTADGALGIAAVKIAHNKVALSFSVALWRGIGCNWLVCLAVWMALASRQTIGKIFAIFFPIMAFVAIGFEHSVANMYFIPTGILLMNVAGMTNIPGIDPNVLGWITFLWRNLLPVTLGNVIGGAVFVGMSYWGAYLRPTKSA